MISLICLWVVISTRGGVVVFGKEVEHGSEERGSGRRRIHADGGVWGHSPTLNLEFHWEDGSLRLYDPVGDRWLPTSSELEAARETAEAARETAEMARETAEVRAEAAEARVAELEAELRRLRGQG